MGRSEWLSDLGAVDAVQEYSPFSRVVDGLMTIPGLARVRACCDQNTKLHGSSEKDIGIEEPGP